MAKEGDAKTGFFPSKSKLHFFNDFTMFVLLFKAMSDNNTFLFTPYH